MKIVVQNVLEANLKINDKLIARISRGFVVFVGFTFGDDKRIVEKMAEKLVNMRVFQDENGKTNLSLKDIDGEILSVSQFTLYGDISSGRRPTFVNALDHYEANSLYEYFNKVLSDIFGPIQVGIFGADMKVNLINDGPFTMILDSKELVK